MSQHKQRVVVLTNPHLYTKATASILIDHGVNVVGIVYAEQTTIGLPLIQAWRCLKRNSAAKAMNKALGKLVYSCLNGRPDAAIFRRLYDGNQIKRSIHSSGCQEHYCRRYADPGSVAFLHRMDADIIVVHSESWVPKLVRDLARSGLVIGGHPGLTPFYRGGHSAFWALHKGRPEDVGWTVFHVDAGVDTGDVIVQGRIVATAEDSFYTLSWKAMIEIANSQAQVILDHERGVPVERHPHTHIPEDSLFGFPTMTDYIRYRRNQQLVR
ncbi:hypothetical protein JL100_016410 [Skermanella mucosa]|uniref:formyltransferase family protein n=1 Tax=Skermanella mucosa TaxID=1789672 RepID=UPI00192AD300|nr:formyltransferase family protein [Skermanella mucosa]UEM18693.1 hypothetical protein JL100_016410 [Skermanella mucosa]